MNWFRGHPLILLIIGLTLPLGVAFLCYDFYDDNDLVCRKQISVADQGDLLSFLRKIPRVLVSAVELFQIPGIASFDVNYFYYLYPAQSPQSTSVLLC